MANDAVARAELIETLDEARAYYRERLARAHEITRYDRKVRIVFEREATHLFSVDEEPRGAADRVERRLGSGRIEVRRFDVERAHLMDHVLPALSNFTVSTSAQNGNRLVHGPRLVDGRYMRVALRPGPGAALTCLSAYPVSEYSWKDAKRSKSARWPP